MEDPTPATEKNKVHTLVGEFVEPIHLQVVCQQRFSTIDPCGGGEERTSSLGKTEMVSIKVDEESRIINKAMTQRKF